MKYAIIVVVFLAVLGVGGFIFAKNQISSATKITPTPTETPLQMLSENQYPKVSLSFKPDGHYVTVMINNLHAESVEYDLVYDAKIKRNGITSQVNTGINASEKISGKNSYSKEQLLGSESSGHLTFHENIQNASLHLTLRDGSNRSIYSTTYPFSISLGKTVELQSSN